MKLMRISSLVILSLFWVLNINLDINGMEEEKLSKQIYQLIGSSRLMPTDNYVDQLLDMAYALTLQHDVLERAGKVIDRGVTKTIQKIIPRIEGKVINLLPSESTLSSLYQHPNQGKINDILEVIKVYIEQIMPIFDPSKIKLNLQNGPQADGYFEHALWTFEMLEKKLRDFIVAAMHDKITKIANETKITHDSDLFALIDLANKVFESTKEANAEIYDYVKKASRALTELKTIFLGIHLDHIADITTTKEFEEDIPNNPFAHAAYFEYKPYILQLKELNEEVIDLAGSSQKIQGCRKVYASTKHLLQSYSKEELTLCELYGRIHSMLKSRTRSLRGTDASRLIRDYLNLPHSLQEEEEPAIHQTQQTSAAPSSSTNIKDIETLLAEFAAMDQAKIDRSQQKSSQQKSKKKKNKHKKKKRKAQQAQESALQPVALEQTKEVESPYSYPQELINGVSTLRLSRWTNAIEQQEKAFSLLNESLKDKKDRGSILHDFVEQYGYLCAEAYEHFSPIRHVQKIIDSCRSYQAVHPDLQEGCITSIKQALEEFQKDRQALDDIYIDMARKIFMDKTTI